MELFRADYQEHPCEGTGSEIKIRQQGGLGPSQVLEKKPKVDATAAIQPVASVPTSVASPKTEVEIQANQCLNYYKPKLRDPSGAYFSEANVDKTVLTMKMHATNGFGGYVTREVKCEFKQSGELDSDWTKIHAQRIGW